jgi:hypothetical protein
LIYHYSEFSASSALGNISHGGSTPYLTVIETIAKVANDQDFLRNYDDSWSALPSNSTKTYELQPEQRVQIMHHYISGTLQELEHNWQHYSKQHYEHIAKLNNKLVIFYSIYLIFGLH